MSNSKTGSLIVMEKGTLLGDITKTGKPVDAQITHELIGNIFFKNSPLHDGAMIMREGKVYAASCFLPKPKSEEDIDKNLGSRHRAAIGISEVSDCVAVVVSEETGIVSIAHEGNIYRNFTKVSMKSTLQDYLITGSAEQKKKQNAKVKINSNK